MTDNQDDLFQDPEPVFGATRLAKYDRNGVESIEVEIFTGKGWVSFEDMLKGDFSGRDDDQ